jgi:hypothetical protein
MVGLIGRRAVQRGAHGRFGEPEGLPSTIEDHEVELREDPHKAPRESG